MKIWSKDASIQIDYFFVQNKENLSNQTIVWSKIDLTSVYLKIHDEFCTLVLVQD